MEQKYLTVARIVRERGNKGEVAAELLTDFPDRLKQQCEIFLARGDPREAGLQDGSLQPAKLALRSFWLDRNHPGQAVFHFVGVDSIGAAQKLRGLLVQIPFEQRVKLPAGAYFVSDLIGCAVFELPAVSSSPTLSSSPCSLRAAPSLLGKVRDVYFPGEGQPGTPLLAIETQQDEILVPLAEDICSTIDVSARRIEVLLPEGLRDLNS